VIGNRITMSADRRRGVASREGDVPGRRGISSRPFPFPRSGRRSGPA
jgi:hypothetical protein